MNSFLQGLQRFERPLRQVSKLMLDTIWPPSCHGCGQSSDQAADELCESCTAAIGSAMRLAHCPGCGSTVAPFELSPEGCGTCRLEGRPFAHVYRTAAYVDGFAEMFRRFKYNGYENLEVFLARSLAREIIQSDHFEQIDVLVPVPTCWQHRLRRNLQGSRQGFHPAEGLARLVSKYTSIPYAPLLDRIQGGPSQVGMSGPARLENVRGKFRLSRGCLVAGGRVCIVDDIMTTGATVRECAKVLRRGNVATVYVAVIARAGEDSASLKSV
ncbi:MAG: amidophosphoribosyltransferase [Phycisphaerae bacterium]|nr:MAG: amidophosphoribosyltransferase [Phycisphaerae bacterium]